jgi:hypothetical protein
MTLKFFLTVHFFHFFDNLYLHKKNHRFGTVRDILEISTDLNSRDQSNKEKNSQIKFFLTVQTYLQNCTLQGKT